MTKRNFHNESNYKTVVRGRNNRFFDVGNMTPGQRDKRSRLLIDRIWQYTHNGEHYKAQCARQTRDAREELYVINEALVVDYLRKNYKKGMDNSEVKRAAEDGLYRATQDTNLRKGKFSTYANACMYSSVRNYLESRRNRAIHIPVYITERETMVCNTINELKTKLKRTPTDTEIIAHLKRKKLKKLSKTEIQTTLEGVRIAKKQVKSFDPKYDREPKTSSQDPLEEIIEKEEIEDTNSTAQTLLYNAGLDKREQEVIKYRKGLEGYEILTLEKIGKKMKVSRERIRQIEAEAIRKMQRFAKQNIPERFAA